MPLCSCGSRPIHLAVCTQWSSQTTSCLLPSANCLLPGGHLRALPPPPHRPRPVLFFPQVYLAFSLAFQHVTTRNKKSNFLSFLLHYQEFSFAVKYGSRRSEDLRSVIRLEAAPAVTGPLCYILNKQFLELIENGLCLSCISFKQACIAHLVQVVTEFVRMNTLAQEM